MNRSQDPLHERHQSLWLLTFSPVIWAVHFMLCYLTAAIWCEKFGGPGSSFNTVRIAIVIYTVPSLIGIFLIGRLGYRRHRHGDSRLPHDFDSPADRHRFLGYATFLLSALSGVAVVYAALVAIFFGNCNG